MIELSRRDALGLAGAAAAMTATGTANAETAAVTPPRAAHVPKPLPFDAAKLAGLSERLILSHWENNYGGSVKALNLIETRLVAAMADSEFPPLVYGDMKREQLHRTGSVVLHELYFGNLGGNGKPGGAVQNALASVFGSAGAWEAEFRRTAASLGGGSGWTVLALNGHTGALVNYWMWDHMHAPAAAVPLLVLDMYEHSYAMDYGAAAARYIDAFMKNVNWEEVDRRFAAARRTTGAG
jgi:Fe-Mn family superoxide dismutase